VNTIEEIEAMQIQLANLKKRIESEIVSENEEFKRERVENKDGYWFIGSVAEIGVLTEYRNNYDDIRFNSFNYFKTKEEAEEVRGYRLKTALFVEAALFYAQEYEFQRGKENWFVWYDTEEDCFFTNCSNYSKHITQIYMNEEQIIKFRDWCNKHKEELI
jgi:hypothetical protein